MTAVKSNLFQYVRPETVAEAVALLGDLGDGASILAGGQSLVPAMALRMATPEVLIDVSAIADMQQITQTDGWLHIGAGCRYADVLASAQVIKAAPLLAQAIPFIAHEAIRNRGTIGGSLAHADPASELPACMIALDATLVLRSPKRVRKVAARAFFLGAYVTDRQDDELLVEVEIPVIALGALHGFLEISRRSGDYAMAGGAFVLTRGAGLITDVRLAFFSVSDRPVLAETAAKAMLGETLTAQVIARAGEMVAEELDFFADLYTGVAAKRQITKTLTQRLLTQFLEPGNT